MHATGMVTIQRESPERCCGVMRKDYLPAAMQMCDHQRSREQTFFAVKTIPMRTQHEVPRDDSCQVPLLHLARNRSISLTLIQ